MRVLHATAECLPFATTGGLGDVLGALPGAQRKLGCDARIVLPRYGFLDAAADGPVVAELSVAGHRARFMESAWRANGAPVYLCDLPGLFDRPGDPYRDTQGREFADLLLRFAVYSQAVARFAGQLRQQPGLGFVPQLVHLHDWHVALASVWLRQQQSMRSVLSIHNLSFQGPVSPRQLDELGLDSTFWPALADGNGGASCLAAGIGLADAVIAVSPGYAREIQTAGYGCGLQQQLRRRAAQGALHGIVNGIDERAWDPRRDPALVRPYGLDDVADGKAANLRALRAELGLPDVARPLAVFVGRLTAQKGADLLAQAGDSLLAQGIQCVFVGVGEPAIAEALRRLDGRSPHCVFRQAYDTALARRVMAAADLLLMPSRFEPCGMTQLYAQRYGTVPVVRRTGGLGDTVVDATADNLARGRATGVLFERAEADQLTRAVQRALLHIADGSVLAALRRAGMTRQLGWAASAAQYLHLYRSLSSSRDDHAAAVRDGARSSPQPQSSSRHAAALTGA